MPGLRAVLSYISRHRARERSKGRALAVFVTCSVACALPSAGVPSSAAAAASRRARLRASTRTAAARRPGTPTVHVAGVQVAHGAATTDAPDPAQLQAALERWTQTQLDLEAMTVAVRVGSWTWTGSARRDGGAGPDPSSRYRVMSVTKTMTAALILRAVAGGRLSLDGPVPAIDGLDAPVPAGLTVRHLLTHRSGLVDYTDATGYRADEPMTPQHAVELSLRSASASPPGTTTHYANSNFLYLGLLLEQVEQRSFKELLEGLVGPLGLDHTTLDPPDRPGWAGYSSGGVVSTASDVAAWGAALFAPDRVLSRPMLEEMTTIGDGRAGMGLWGECPCRSQAASGRPEQVSALGHHTAAGGLFVVPTDGASVPMVLVTRAEPAGGDSAGRALALAALLRAAMGRSNPA